MPARSDRVARAGGQRDPEPVEQRDVGVPVVVSALDPESVVRVITNAAKQRDVYDHAGGDVINEAFVAMASTDDFHGGSRSVSRLRLSKSSREFLGCRRCVNKQDIRRIPAPIETLQIAEQRISGLHARFAHFSSGRSATTANYDDQLRLAECHSSLHTVLCADTGFP